MMSVIEPQFQRDFISLLPKELALYVLSFLKPRDLLNAAQTCRYWRILAEDNLLWREKCREAGMSEAVCNSGAAAAAKRKKSSNFLYSAWKVSSQIRLQTLFIRTTLSLQYNVHGFERSLVEIFMKIRFNLFS